MPEGAFSVAACLAAVARDDEQAARELVEHLHPLVRRLVRAHLPRSLAEEDLEQEVFMKLFARLHTYREMDGIPFEHWVSRVTVRTCLDRLRSERREPAGALSAGASEWLLSLRTDGAAPAHDVLAARELVSALLGTLPPRDRLLLTLLDLEDRSVAEVARITGYGTTLVKVRAFRARRRLRAAALALGAAPGGAS